MKRFSLSLLVGALAVGAPISLASVSAAEPPAAEAPAEVSAPFAACSELLQQAVDAVNSLQSADDAERVGAALGAAFDAVDVLPEPTATEAELIRRGLIAVAEAWWAAGARTADIEIAYAPALLYQLYIRSTPLTEVLLEENCTMSGTLSMEPTRRDSSPDLKREQEAWLTAVQPKHASVNQKIYGGGNGASEEAAIELLPFIGQQTEPEEDAVREVIFAYLREVYGCVDACYMAYQYNPDGSFYKICCLYKGTFRDSEGKLQLRVLPVYFRVK